VWADRHEAHIARHRVTVDEAEEALADPAALWRRRDERFEVLGATRAGRVLLVVVEPIGRRLAVVVTAFDAPAASKRRYRKGRT
jgi:hypothetical protein